MVALLHLAVENVTKLPIYSKRESERVEQVFFYLENELKFHYNTEEGTYRNLVNGSKVVLSFQ